MEQIEYIEVMDEDFHSYIIPYIELNNWYDWIESTSDDVPEYAVRVDGGNVVFTQWRIA